MNEAQRSLFESAVIERLKEGGFLEIEIRVECLVRCDDGYQDEVVNAGWHYWNAAIAAQPTPAPTHISVVGKFALGDRVRKTKGSSWQGRVVGFYSTALTPIGYAVESEREPGSVQIYPESALAAISASEVEG